MCRPRKMWFTNYNTTKLPHQKNVPEYLQTVRVGSPNVAAFAGNRMNNSSNTLFQVEAEPIVSVQLKFIHPHGSVSKYEQEFSLVSPIRLLKEDMALKLSVEVDRQVWIHKGVLLEDNDTLAEHGVDDEDSIEVIQN